MFKTRILRSAATLDLALPVSGMAQDDPDGSTPAANQGEILVIGDRIRGQVDTEVAPVLELNSEEIGAYGASTIADLVTALEPQTSSNRGRGGGRPVFLINGVRIGSFREFRSYPSEAIEKVEVLPEEVAQKFGFAPDRRVVNFILKDNYSALTGEVEYEQPDRGGYSVTEQELTLLKITKGARINANVERNASTALTEAERNIEQAEGSIPGVETDPDPAEFRTLIADRETYEASLNYAKAFIESGTSVSLNGSFARTDSTSLSGLDSVVLFNTDDLNDPAREGIVRTFNAQDPLSRQSRTDTFSSAGSFNTPVGDFILTATADASLTDSLTYIERRADVSQLVADAAAGLLDIRGPLPILPDAGFDTSDRDTITLDSKVTLAGSPLFLPGGELQTTLDAGYGWDRIESADTRSGKETSLSRGNFSAGINVTVPITSTRENFLPEAGTIALNGNLAINELSDFGTLLRWSAGINWEPLEGLDLQATYVRREVAPTLSQLGNPQIDTFNVPTFDFTNNTTELVTVTTGGNPALERETQSDWSFSANWRIPFIENARFNVNYSTNRSDNVSSSFPFLTPEIEAAFPGRITRDGDGRLTAVDLRPVDFFETRSKRLSFGLNLSGQIGKAPERSGPPPGMGRGGGGGRGPGGARAGGPPAGAAPEDRRARFMALREKICADDGEAFLMRLVEAAEKGETLDDLPDFDPAQASRMLDRLRKEDGTINRERLTGFRTMMCSADSPMARRGQSGGEQQSGGSSDAAPSQGGGGDNGRRGRRGGAAAAFFGGGGDSRARYFLSLTHSIELEREILIAQGGPQLDLLDVDTLTSSGTPRHTSRLEGGIFKSGIGMRISGSYTGKARINGSGAPQSTDLFLDDLARFDLRLFTNLGELLNKDEGLFKNLRVSFRIDNVFDGRRLVRDSNGDTPIGFQPLLLDPTGRYVGVDIRKLF